MNPRPARAGSAGPGQTEKEKTMTPQPKGTILDAADDMAAVIGHLYAMAEAGTISIGNQTKRDLWKAARDYHDARAVWNPTPQAVTEVISYLRQTADGDNDSREARLADGLEAYASDAQNAAAGGTTKLFAVALLDQALETVAVALQYRDHWQPSMVPHLIGIIDGARKAADTAMEN